MQYWLLMALGFAIATLAKLNRPTTKALTIEVGIQNGTLAIAVASAPIFLNNLSMAIPPAPTSSESEDLSQAVMPHSSNSDDG